MTRLTVAAEVCEAFPGLAVAAVVAEGVDGQARWEETERLLADVEAAAADGTWAAPEESDPLLASWQGAYRAFGTNPRRFRPSMDALARRLAKSGRLPRIGSAVDTYNAVSVSHHVPAGAFDLAAVRGDIALRHAGEGEAFTPLGEPGTTEEARPGEVIYADADGVLTRHWNHRDSDRTKVTPASRDILFLMEAVDHDAGRKAVTQAADRLAVLLAPRAARVTPHLLDPATPTATLR
ncbi:phenylalanine--tRNA ligase beta subunit-related protein [Streptomyces sp. DSM 44917]|uniref:Phenylalanine--tRNA ligase beta subunit-related protein n=1 Tax=Streptomyces boetiae TaxID=3075541 RepID=A0ABU2LEI5_9ACTN|nr:phenylalanine--tRNA ligase beta subunit-related protein [Streptomyces sp. DSM 44917]MDT0309911.1 phenylalanine--tRNA ligase beta subunit-related protein [Streptomyces sp. DSM 44917]